MAEVGCKTRALKEKSSRSFEGQGIGRTLCVRSENYQESWQVSQGEVGDSKPAWQCLQGVRD